MYIYNVTINIEESVHDQWLAWMTETHIPDMLATGKFTAAKVCRVLVEEETGGLTYAIQYTTVDKKTLEKYYREDADRLRQESMKHFADKFVAFRTELEVINEQKIPFPAATEYLFAYGTLQDETTQISLFSRVLEGVKDYLSEYKVSNEKVAGLYPTIIRTGSEEDRISGLLFTVSGPDLLKADAYEGDGYHRKKVALASGINAWVYMSNSNKTQ